MDVFWYHPEHLGGTNFMTGVNGTELQDAYSEYTPFGSALPTRLSNTGPGPYQNQDTPDAAIDRSGGFQLTGKELDDTGLYYHGHATTTRLSDGSWNRTRSILGLRPSI